MGYIGNQTSNSYTSIAKQDLTGVTGSPVKRGFTLDHAVANANEIEVFVNNVRQEPTEAYTVSGTGLTMTGDVETTDDFYVVFQGKALQTTVPPDDSVTTARINDGAVTTAKIAANAVSTAKLFSGFTNGITMADQFRLHTSVTTNDTVLANWERPTDANGNDMLFTQLGTGMTESSGVFSFPSTGFYVVVMQAELYSASGDSVVGVDLEVTEDNSTYVISQTASIGGGSGFNRGSGLTVMSLMNVTDTSNQKIRLVSTSLGSGSDVSGRADQGGTQLLVFRIADSQ